MPLGPAASLLLTSCVPGARMRRAGKSAVLACTGRLGGAALRTRRAQFFATLAGAVPPSAPLLAVEARMSPPLHMLYG